MTRVSGTCNYKCDKTLSMANTLRLILRRGGGGTVPPKLKSAVVRSDKTLPILAHIELKKCMHGKRMFTVGKPFITA